MSFNPNTINSNSQFIRQNGACVSFFLSLIRNSPKLKDFFLVLFVRIRWEASVYVEDTGGDVGNGIPRTAPQLRLVLTVHGAVSVAQVPGALGHALRPPHLWRPGALLRGRRPGRHRLHGARNARGLPRPHRRQCRYVLLSPLNCPEDMLQLGI